MRISTFATLSGIALVLAAGLVWSTRTSAEEDTAAQVRKSCSAFVAAFNKHDPKAMAANFTEDGDAMNPFGMMAKGRAEVEKMFAMEQTNNGPLSQSSIEVKDEPIRNVTADVAVSDATVQLTGAMGPDGKPGAPMMVHVTNVWKKTGDKWLCAASRAYTLMAPPGGAKPTDK